jgi:AraC family transcriptional regulator, regulatory protein of adaptative response / DNA-3-methyladenine glycosylase II
MANLRYFPSYYRDVKSLAFPNQLVVGLDHDTCYKAFVSHDSRFDGRLFVGVRTTRIYCRPVCRVKPPLQKNCTFYPNAAQAEQFGFRPCLRCRPELSPGFSVSEASSRLAHAAAAALQFPGRQALSMEGLASRIGVSSRHLRRLFAVEFGVSPVEYAQTQRLLLAKRLLTDTGLPMNVVAHAAGFRSARRFNDLFQMRYRLSPSTLRKEGKLNANNLPLMLNFHLAYRPPYAWVEQLQYLAGRILKGVEHVDLDASVYWRSASIENHQGWIRVGHVPEKSSLQVSVSQSLAPVVGDILVLVRRLFDLDARLDEVHAVLMQASGFDFAPLIAAVPGLRLAGSFNGFELSLRAVLGQLVSVKAAHATASKVVAAFGIPLSDQDPCPCHQITLLTPKPEAFLNASQEALGALGLTRQKQAAIKGIAQALVDKQFELTPSADVQATIAQLKAIHGIGDWTAQYIAMRAMAWPDAYPGTDYGVLKALACTPSEANKLSQSWRPWRAYATRYLWHSLK